jgi:hypothetical protein
VQTVRCTGQCEVHELSLPIIRSSNAVDEQTERDRSKCSITLIARAGTTDALAPLVSNSHHPKRTRTKTMKTITTSDLNTVCGGASKADSAVTTQLTALQGSIKDLAANNNKSSSSDSMLPLLMVMAMGNKQQGSTTVVQGAAAPVVQGGPVVNIRSRVRF